MRNYKLIYFLVGSVFCFLNAKSSAVAENETSIEGKWDITMMVDGKPSPSWLEVNHSGTTHLVGQYVGVSGSARPISKITFKDNKLSFTIPTQWEKVDADITFDATYQGDSLIGTLLAGDGKTYNLSGHRAPLLVRTMKPAWEKPVTLFKGDNMDAWHALGENQWIAKDGVLKSPHSGANLITNQTYNDFKLHIEFRCPSGSNSGVYLRGRYEVQIEDSKGKQPQKDLLAAIYGFLTPNEMAAKSADEWQTFDITLIGRLVTVVANGKEVISRQTIPGITGGALDSDEEKPGPVLLQGDHGPIEYRNIIITPAK
jgi:hypothetical protein